jgi:ferredoxin
VVLKMIIIDDELCTGCGRCEDICDTGAIRINKTTLKAEFDKYRCAECGACIDECMKGAISFDKKTVMIKK